MLALGLTPERTLEQLVLDGASSDGGRLFTNFRSVAIEAIFAWRRHLRDMSVCRSPSGADVKACAPASSPAGWGLRGAAESERSAAPFAANAKTGIDIGGKGGMRDDDLTAQEKP